MDIEKLNNGLMKRNRTIRKNALNKCLDYSMLIESAKLYVADNKPKVGEPKLVADLMRPIFIDKLQEEMWALHLDSRNKVITMNLITIGLADRSQAHAREVFRKAIVENACRVILVHNHPAGDPTPSPQDVECTRLLVAAGKIIGIEVIDHVVIGKMDSTRIADYVSMRAAGLM